MCHDVGATTVFIVHSRDDVFPVGDGLRVISLKWVIEKLATSGL